MESILEETEKLIERPIPTANPNQEEEEDFQVTITGSVLGNNIGDETTRFIPKLIPNIEIKREVASKQTTKLFKNITFTKEEDIHLRQGIQKYGIKSWAAILKDKDYKFHKSRTRDSLRMRANSAAFKNFNNKHNEPTDTVNISTF